jgi:hypothetical protein
MPFSSLSASPLATRAPTAIRPPLNAAQLAAYRARCRKHLAPPRRAQADQPLQPNNPKELHDQLHDDLP